MHLRALYGDKKHTSRANQGAPVTTTSLTDSVLLLDPCPKGAAYLRRFADDPRRAWEECDRVDWMVWLLGKLSPEFDDALRYFARWCALSVIHLWPDPGPPDVVLDYLMTGDETIREAAGAA